MLVTETSVEVNAGKVTFVTRGGQKNTLIGNLPSGVDNTGGSSGPSGLALRGRTLYVLQGAGDSERRGQRPGSFVWNNEGISSPIHSSVLVFQLPKDVDDAQGPYAMTPALQKRLADGFEAQLTDRAGNMATATLLLDLPDLTPDPDTIFRGSNPFSLALSDDGNTLWLADASQNSVFRVDTRTGRAQRTFSFPPSPNPTPVGGPVIEAVPTGLRLFNNRLIVSFLSGFPFVAGFTQVWELNPRGGNPIPQIAGLTAATDVLVRNNRGVEEWYVLEFSLNLNATPAAPGRMLMFDSPIGREIVPVLITPVSMAYDERTNSMLILELIGQIVEVRLP